MPWEQSTRTSRLRGRRGSLGRLEVPASESQTQLAAEGADELEGRFCELAAGTALSPSPWRDLALLTHGVLCLHQVTGCDLCSVSAVLTLGSLASRVDLNVCKARRC